MRYTTRAKRRGLALVIALVALVAAGAPARAQDLPPERVHVPSACDQGPSTSQPQQSADLDHRASDWGVFCEPSPITGGFATWRMQNVAAPSIDGEALECAIAGGAPYSNIHCYRNLAFSAATVAVTLTATFQMLPGPTCADAVTACSQALEFSVSKWQSGRRYEWALQWQNIGGPCPRWRYWDPTQRDRWVPLSPPRAEVLQAGRWYTLTLEGEIWQGLTRYVRFDVAERLAPSRPYFFGPLDLPPATASANLNVLALAVQLDGQEQQRPYSALLDQVAIAQGSQPGFSPPPPRQYLPLVSVVTAAPPSDGC